MTLAELVTEMSKQYPSTVEISTRISYLNQGLSTLEDYFDNYAMATSTTVANQDEYALPTGIEDISQIYTFGIGNSATPANRYDYARYEASTVLDYPNVGNVYYQLTDSDGDKKIIVHPAPTTSGLPINIIYKKHYAELAWSTNTASPEFDSRYHILLVYYANHMIATTGHAPDTMQADMFMQKWLDGLNELTRKRARANVAHPKKARDNPQWHSGKRHVAGTTVPIVLE